jgi:hypothetical protein
VIMGMNSTVFILNDYLPRIQANPKGFVSAMNDAIMLNKPGPFFGGDTAQLVCSEDANAHPVIVAGGNMARVLCYPYFKFSGEQEEWEEDALKAIAAEMGYSVRKLK